MYTNSGTLNMNDDDSRLNVRDARAHFAEVITRPRTGAHHHHAQRAGRGGSRPYRGFQRPRRRHRPVLRPEADRDLAENPDAPTYSMSEVVAAIFEESPARAPREVRVPVAGTGSPAAPRRPAANRADDLAGAHAAGRRSATARMPTSRSSPDTPTVTGCASATTGSSTRSSTSQLIILVVGVGHRREAYRALS